MSNEVIDTFEAFEEVFKLARSRLNIPQTCPYTEDELNYLNGCIDTAEDFFCNNIADGTD
jgi:hypothetical protein